MPLSDDELEKKYSGKTAPLPASSGGLSEEELLKKYGQKAKLPPTTQADIDKALPKPNEGGAAGGALREATLGVASGAGLPETTHGTDFSVLPGLGHMIRHPLDSASLIGGSIYGGSKDLIQRGAKEWKEDPSLLGRTQAVGHMAAGVVPIIGPAANAAGEEIEQGLPSAGNPDAPGYHKGDLNTAAHGFGQAAGLLGTLALARGGAKNIPEETGSAPWYKPVNDVNMNTVVGPTGAPGSVGENLHVPFRNVAEPAIRGVGKVLKNPVVAGTALPAAVGAAGAITGIPHALEAAGGAALGEVLPGVNKIPGMIQGAGKTMSQFGLSPEGALKTQLVESPFTKGEFAAKYITPEASDALKEGKILTSDLREVSPFPRSKETVLTSDKVPSNTLNAFANKQAIKEGIPPKPVIPPVKPVGTPAPIENPTAAAPVGASTTTPPTAASTVVPPVAPEAPPIAPVGGEAPKTEVAAPRVKPEILSDAELNKLSETLANKAVGAAETPALIKNAPLRAQPTLPNIPGEKVTGVNAPTGGSPLAGNVGYQMAAALEGKPPELVEAIKKLGRVDLREALIKAGVDMKDAVITDAKNRGPNDLTRRQAYDKLIEAGKTPEEIVKIAKPEGKPGERGSIKMGRSREMLTGKNIGEPNLSPEAKRLGELGNIMREGFPTKAEYAEHRALSNPKGGLPNPQFLGDVDLGGAGTPPKPIPGEGGGHAGGGVASLEEIKRLGTHFMVDKGGNISHYGKEWAPEKTPRGGAFISVMPDNTIRVNTGSVSEAVKQRILADLKK